MASFGKAEGLEWRTITAFILPGSPGSERQAIERVAEAVRELRLPSARLERLKIAVAEAVVNAIEHGCRFEAELPVQVRVSVSVVKRAVSVSVTDQGCGAIPASQRSDLQTKLDGWQSPWGGGFFLIEKMGNRLRAASDESHYTVELFLYQEGDDT